ncbi:kinase-like domain-containing protein [Syncephalis plumigaleata]|nr:kinase-like domain-containing protein [Syncephalis plumigaleata]
MYSANHGARPSRVALHGEGTLIQRLTDFLTPSSINTNRVGSHPNSDEDKNTLGQSGLSISSWIQNTKTTRIGIGTYNEVRIRLKCSKYQWSNAMEMQVLEASNIEEAAKKTNDPLSIGSQWVSRKRHSFWTVDGLHCMVMSEPGHSSLYQYMIPRQYNERCSVMRSVFKQLIRAVAFLHFAGVTHNSIKPEYIRVYINQHRLLEISLVDYSQATLVQSNTHTSEFGWCEIDPRTNDVWAIGMTVYACLTGFPLYGYINVGKETWQMSRQAYQTELARLYHAHRGTNDHALIADEAWESFNAIGFLSAELLTFDPQLRPTLTHVINANPL